MTLITAHPSVVRAPSPVVLPSLRARLARRVGVLDDLSFKLVAAIGRIMLARDELRVLNKPYPRASFGTTSQVYRYAVLLHASHIPTTSSTSAPTRVNSTNRTYLNPPLLQYLHVFPRRFHLNVPSQRHPSYIGRLLRILRLELGRAGVDRRHLFSSSTTSLDVIHPYFPSKQHPSPVGRLLRA